MANERRIRSNLLTGVITDNPLTTTSTVITSASFANLPVVDTTTHLPIVLNPSQAAVPSTNAEVVYVTSHTSGATSATVVRAREGTNATGFNSTTVWVHGPLVSDHAPTIVDVSGSLPSSGGLPFKGQLAYVSNTGQLQQYTSTSAWVDVYNPGAWTAFTPTIEATGGWAAGNAVLDGTYRKIGRLVVAKVLVQIGSSTTKGAGNLNIGGLPFASAFPNVIGTTMYHDADVTTNYPGQWYVGFGVTSGEMRFHASGPEGGATFLSPCDRDSPFTWDTSDTIEGTLVYESTS